MHEHGLAKELWPQLRAIAEAKGLRRVYYLEMIVGMLHGVTAETLEHSFEHAFEGTGFQDADVEVVIVDPGELTGLRRGEVVSDERKRQLDQEFAGKYVAMMGAEGIKELLKKSDVEALSLEIREKMRTEVSQQKKLKYAKRLRVAESFRKSGNKPEWMILDVLPVIPPELRPLVPLDG